ncbi:hypothetical protein BLJAPNOD_05238 [Ensifer sp. M14]|nr:hypothetical protein BLJAPNOD_05238 [Ensifer sp. M14]
MTPPNAEELPFFVTAPGGTDYLFVGVTIAFPVIVMLMGVLFLRLHHLPDHIAGRGEKVQLELVAVLGLISMLTHNNLFWIAALLLALITVPDISAPLASIAHDRLRPWRLGNMLRHPQAFRYPGQCRLPANTAQPPDGSCLARPRPASDRSRHTVLAPSPQNNPEPRRRSGYSTVGRLPCVGSMPHRQLSSAPKDDGPGACSDPKHAQPLPSSSDQRQPSTKP